MVIRSVVMMAVLLRIPSAEYGTLKIYQDCVYDYRFRFLFL